MKLLLLLEKFKPDITASGNLVFPLLKYFSNYFEIEVLSTSQKSSDILTKEFSNIKFPSVQESIVKKTAGKVFKKKAQPNPFMAEYIFEKINYSKQIILMPVTINEIALAIEAKKTHPSIVFLTPFLLEILPENYLTSRLKKDLEQYSDIIFSLPKLDGYFENYEKVKFVEHPMVVDNTKQNSTDNNIVNFVYIGGFNRKSRSIKPLINFIKNINKVVPYNNFVFNIYGYGNEIKYLEKANKEIKNLSYYGPVSSDDAKDKLREANFIFTIGNKDPKLVPSKIFDCISTGNPIIHFMQSENDPYINYLSKYPLSICLDYKNINSNLFLQFIKEKYNQVISYDYLKTNYKIFTPAHVSKIMIEEIMEGTINNEKDL